LAIEEYSYLRPDAIFPETNPAISIAEARNLAPNTLVRVRGIVTRAWGRFIYIQDQTGAIAVRQPSGAMVDAINNGTLKQGDSVEVIGPRNNFNNYAQIQLLSGAYRSTNTVNILGSNRAVTPVTITVAQFNQNPEFYESRLVRIQNLRTNATGNFTASTNYTVWDGSNIGDTTIIRVIAAQDTELDDAPALAIPNSIFTFEGIGAQFCSSPENGCKTGYQLYAVTKKDIIANPQPFTLANPANNIRLVTSSSNNNPVNINWNKSGNALNYRWVLDIATGNFTSPLLSLTPTNNGSDTFVSLTVSAIDAFLSQNGIRKGDSIVVKWTVIAYRNNDSLLANQSFNLLLVREKLLNNFNLLTPANNARLVVEENSTTPINITWSNSFSGASYKWMAATLNGNFTNPLLSLPSNNSGSATTLTLTSGTIDGILAANGLAKGDSITLQWTVFAFDIPDSLKANQTFNINFVRARATSVNNAKQSLEVNIYPNPVKDVLFIESTKLDVSAEVLSIDGKILLQSNSGKLHSIDVSGLAKGMYIIKLQHANEIIVKRIIID
jgi:hypothetical protein